MASAGVRYIVPTTHPTSNLRLQVRATARIPCHAEPVRFAQGTLLIPCHAERSEASPQFLPTPKRSILHANCRDPSSPVG
jgi:hypothetical protein